MIVLRRQRTVQVAASRLRRHFGAWRSPRPGDAARAARRERYERELFADLLKPREVGRSAGLENAFATWWLGQKPPKVWLSTTWEEDAGAVTVVPFASDKREALRGIDADGFWVDDAASGKPL